MLRTSSIHIYDHFDLYSTPVILTFNLPKNVSNGTSPPQEQQLCQIVLKSTHYCTSYGPDKSGQTHGRTHIHRTKIVTTMSRLPASGLDKNRRSCFFDMGFIIQRTSTVLSTLVCLLFDKHRKNSIHCLYLHSFQSKP